MRNKLSSIFWGIIFILGGLALLAYKLNWIDFNSFSTDLWVYIIGGIGLLFLVGFFVSLLKQWGLLFPGLILLGVAATIWLADRGVVGSFLGTPILLGIAIPFYVGFALNRRNWGLLIPAWVMTVIALVTFAADRAGGNLIGAVFMYAIAAPFLMVYLMKRSRWWALIPGGVLFVLGTTALLSGLVNGNLVGAFFMYCIALAFFIVYQTNHAHRWALIPAAAMAVFGTIPLLSAFISGNWMGVVVMLIFAAPFFYLFFRWPDNWWALIPAGIFASIAITALLDNLIPHEGFYTQGVSTAVLLFLFAATFGILWLMRARRPTAWAGIPAAGLLVAAVLSALIGNTEIIWAAALLVAGLILVGYTLIQRKPTSMA